MSEQKRRCYGKGDASELPKQGAVRSAESEADEFVFLNVTEGYSKQESFEDPKTFMIIVSGGEVREKQYFKLISREDRFLNIKIAFIAEPTNPDEMLEVAKQKMEHFLTSQPADTPDSYFLLSDVDHFYNDLIRIKPVCESLGLQLIISNPCFEVWLYYSKRVDQFEGFAIPKKKLEISSALKTFLDVAISGGCNPKKAIFDIRTNITHAKTNYREDEKGIPELFATSMFRLAEWILPYIDAELEKIKEDNAKNAAVFKGNS